MLERAASRRRIRHVVTAALAAAVVYLSTPRVALTGTEGVEAAPPVSADAVTCPTELFVLDNNQMYDVDPATGTVTGARAFCPGGPGFAAFYVDVAPDGSYWGSVSPNCSGAWQWGRVEPDAIVAGGNATGIIPLATLPYAYARMRPSFVADMPPAGSPIGYRFSPRPPSADCPPGASPDPACALDLFAVDTLSPYSEHLVAADVGPVRFNFSIGTAVSQDGSNVFHVTTDAIYCYGAGPLCPGTVSTGKIQQIGFLSIYGISRNAVVLGSNEGNVFYIADGGELLRVDAATGDVTTQLLPPLSQIVSGARRPCVPGGVRIEAADAELITTETGGIATFTAVLTATPTADVTVGFTSSNTSEGTVSPSSVTFTTADWNVPKTITITGVNDGVADGPQAYTIVTSDAASSDPNYSGRAVLDVPVKNYVDYPPTIVASPQSLIAGLARSGVTLATVSDVEDSAASLSVSATSVHADLALGPLVSTGGVITADLSASCSAASATRTITLQVTDSVGNVRTTDVPITVTANQAPSIGFYDFPGPTIAQGGGTVLWPNFAPDPTFLDTFTVTPVAGYAGSATLDRATGSVTLANASPRGLVYFVVRATSFCGSTTSYYAYAVVQNDAPTLGSYSNATVPAGGGTTVAASGGPSDDGSIAGMSVSAPGFTGTLSVDPSTGNVTVANADPPGSFVVQVKATDNLGVTGSASFTLTVDPPSPLPACTAALYTVLNDEPARLATVDGSGTVTAGPALSGLAFNSVLPVLAMDFSPGGALYAIVAKSDESLAWARIDPDSGAVTELGPFASMPGDFTLGRSPTGPVRGYMTELSPIACSPPCSSAQVDSVRSIESLNPLATSFHRLTNSGSPASWPPLLSAPRGLPALALSRDEQSLFALGTNGDVAYSYAVANPQEFTNSGFSIAGYTNGSLRTTMDAPPDADLFSFFHGSVGVTADPLSGNTATALSQAVRGVAAWRRCANAPVIDIATPPSLEQGAAASAKSVGAVRDSADAAGSIVMSAPVVPSGVTIAAPVNSGGAITASMSAACSASLGRSYAAFRATDSSGLFADEALPIDVTANQPPVVGYAAARVRLGAGGAVTPSTALADAGSVASVTATSPTFAGTLTGSAANGGITVAAAAPAGNHTITVVATDNCGATTSTTFTLTVDAPPSIAPSSPSVQAGSPPASVALGTIADAEDVAGTLAVAATSVPAGLTLGAITNTNGALTAPLSASCSATPGTHAIGLEVTDSAGNVTAGTVNVTVTTDASPSLGAYADTTLVPGASITVTASAAPADNGSLASVTVAAPGFGGTLAVNATSGAVTIGSATPAGVFTVTVTATDNCGKTASASFSLSVNTPPAVTPAAGISVQQGSPAATVAIGTASDPEQSAGSIAITSGPLPPGITLGPILNSGGALSASLSASCVAAIQSHTVSLTATDGAGGSTTVDLTFAVTANAPPSLGAYAPLTLSTGAGATASPGAAPADNGTISSVTVAAPGFAGTVSVDASTGAITIANASPAGPHTITVTATDQCGASSTATLALSVDGVPAIAPAPVAVTKASPASAVTLASVSDLEDAAGSLTVTATSVPAGLTLGAIANTNGTITAPVAASCALTTGTQTIVLQVADSRGQTATANVTVNVAENPPPVHGTYSPATLATGGGAVVSSSAPPTDNGAVASVTVSAPGFSGAVSVDAAGAITIANASPAGAHTITVTATDDCGATATATLVLTVDAVPSIAAAAPIAAQQGSPASTVTLATVSDAEDAAGSLTVVATSVPPGITLGPLANTNGAITASLAASCAAATGAQTITLQVTDSRGQTSSANVTLNVSANSPPLLGTYASVTLPSGGGTIASPSSPPADNGTIATAAVAAPGFGGTASVAATGAITITNASPGGPHTLTVTFTDNCGAASISTLTLTVDAGPAIAAAPPIPLTQASPAGVVTLATVSDAEDAAGSLTVTATGIPAGIALGTITNTNGTITAPLSASCAAATGASTLTLQVVDSRGQTASASVSLNVAANPPPILGAYAPMTLSSGGATTAAPNAPPSDNGAIGSITVAAPGFAGSVSVDASTGTLTIANASPPGSHTITVTATDTCGATTTATLSLTVDGGPAIVPAPSIALTQASSGSVVTLATVSDAEDAAGSLAVVATSVPAGITLGTLTNASGTITASLAASCAAATGAQTIALQVTDSRGQTATANATLDVALNSPPILGAYAPVVLSIGAGTAVSPSAPPQDNGTVASIAVAAPGFGGTVSVDPGTGSITIANASPAGTHAITLTATDDCGATATATLALTVDGAPSIAAAPPIAITQASAATIVNLATVSDAADAPGSLAVTATSIPAGITLGALTNTNGTITASVAAGCSAASGAQTITLRVTDSRGQSASADVALNVAANPAPALGSYAPAMLVAGAGGVFAPSAPPLDNGTVASVTVAAPGFSGSVSVAATGAVTIANAGPAGGHTITVTATDDCGATSTASLALTVPAASIAELSPGGACQNASPLTLAVVGSGFEPGMQVVWNGAPRPTTFVGSTRLEIAVGASDLAAPSTVSIAVASATGTPLTPSIPFTIATDAIPPAVVAPPPLSIVETLAGGIAAGGPHGATPASSTSLRDFLTAAAATDFCSATRSLGPRLASGAPILSETLFPPGLTPVRFYFDDATGNTGVAESAVTVWRYGSLLVPDREPGAAELLMLANVVQGKIALGSARFPAPPAAADLDGDGVADAHDLALFHDYLDATSVPLSGPRRRLAGRPGPDDPAVHPLLIASSDAALGAFVARVRFDPSRVEIVAVEPGVPAEFARSIEATTLAVANRTGLLIVAGAQTSATSPRGSIEVARLRYRELAAGGAASITVALDVAPAIAAD